MRTSKFRAASLVAAGLIALSGVSMPSMVLAQVPAVTNPTYTTVNPDADVSLTINKFLGDPGDTSTPNDGAVFRVEKVRINAGTLDNAAAWTEIANLTPENAQIDPSFPAADLLTAGGGIATISTGTNSNFKVGVYKITEQSRAGFTVAKPFLVTLPFVDTNTGQWAYAQTVQPKNQTIKVTKTVNDAGKTVGDEVEYFIDSNVPAENLTEFSFEDVLPKGMSLAKNPEVSYYTDVNQQTTIAAAHASHAEVALENRTKVTVTFGETERQQLSGLRQGKPDLKVRVKITARIDAIPNNDGTPQNGAYVNEAKVNLPNGGSATSDPVQSQFGSLVVTKNTNPAGGDVTGTKFQLYECTEQQNRWTVTPGAQPIPVTTTAGVDGKVTEFEIQNGNTVTVNGIQNPEWINGVMSDKKYCVVETKAPSGFNLNPNPQPVTKSNANPGSPYDLAATVVNEKDSIIGQLPATGEKGVFALMIAGAMLLVGGVWARLRHNRKAQQ